MGLPPSIPFKQAQPSAMQANNALRIAHHNTDLSLHYPSQRWWHEPPSTSQEQLPTTIPSMLLLEGVSSPTQTAITGDSSPTSSYSEDSTTTGSQTDSFPPSPPKIIHAVCNAPLIAPVPLPYHSPTFLQFDLPDEDEDLSHPPYFSRPHKRKRESDDSDEPATKLFLHQPKRRATGKDWARWPSAQLHRSLQQQQQQQQQQHSNHQLFLNGSVSLWPVPPLGYQRCIPG